MCPVTAITCKWVGTCHSPPVPVSYVIETGWGSVDSSVSTTTVSPWQQSSPKWQWYAAPYDCQQGEILQAAWTSWGSSTGIGKRFCLLCSIIHELSLAYWYAKYISSLGSSAGPKQQIEQILWLAGREHRTSGTDKCSCGSHWPCHLWGCPFWLSVI